MEIRKDIQHCLDEIAHIAYESYQKELSFIDHISINSFDMFREYLIARSGDMHGLICLDNGRCNGYILYELWEDASQSYCHIPEWGYGACDSMREKTIVFLFQLLAEELVKEQTVTFSVNLYAHDTDIQRLFSFMEFGTQAETGIRFLAEAPDLNPLIETRQLSKAEVTNRWDEIWQLLSQLIEHLQKSPVFYPGHEFTEEVYREFFEDAGTSVYIAEDNNRIVGLIETNKENISPVFLADESANIGEVFVLPEYRGNNIAQTLLNHAIQDLRAESYQYAWVEHGTANPNARYFWNKYFTTYKYEMIRKITPISPCYSDVSR